MTFEADSCRHVHIYTNPHTNTLTSHKCTLREAIVEMMDDMFCVEKMVKQLAPGAERSHRTPSGTSNVPQMVQPGEQQMIEPGQRWVGQLAKSMVDHGRS